MTAELRALYREYITCLNKQDWRRLGEFVDDEVFYNGRQIGLAGYRQMLERDFEAIPDLRFDPRLLVCEPPHLASRLLFDCTPKSELFGLRVNGKRVTFSENVFYEFGGGRIVRVWSIIDRAAIEAQL